jgi:transcriptional regulator with XRE-family HTH domain
VLAVFKFVWKELKVQQTEIARETGLDQGSVSKILRGSFDSLKGRAYRLWKYAKGRADKGGYKPGQASGVKSDVRLAEKINRVWDQTEEGAKALLKLLDAADLIQRRRSAHTARRKASGR